MPSKTPSNRVEEFVHQIFFYLFLVFISVAGLYLVRNYLATIVLAIIFSIFLQPVYFKLKDRLRGSSFWAVTIVVVALCAVVVIPLVTFLVYLANEIIRVTQTLALNQVVEPEGTRVLLSLSDQTIDITSRLQMLNSWLRDVTFGQYTITLEQLQNFLQSSVVPIRQWAILSLVSIGSGSVNFLLKLFMFIILLVSLIPNQRNLVAFVKNLSPLDDEINEMYLIKIRAMATSMVAGTFLIALIQSSLSAGMLWIAGVPYVLTLFILMFFCCMLPMLGAPLVTVPIGVMFMLNGQFVTGLLIILVQLLLISNVDNILRPKLISKNASLHPALLLLAVFGGLELFGFLGVVYGPVIMILVVTTYQVYLKYYATNVKVVKQ